MKNNRKMRMLMGLLLAAGVALGLPAIAETDGGVYPPALELQLGSQGMGDHIVEDLESRGLAHSYEPLPLAPSLGSQGMGEHIVEELESEGRATDFRLCDLEHQLGSKGMNWERC